MSDVDSQGSSSSHDERPLVRSPFPRRHRCFEGNLRMLLIPRSRSQKERWSCTLLPTVANTAISRRTRGCRLSSMRWRPIASASTTTSSSRRKSRRNSSPFLSSFCCFCFPKREENVHLNDISIAESMAIHQQFHCRRRSTMTASRSGPTCCTRTSRPLPRNNRRPLRNRRR